MSDETGVGGRARREGEVLPPLSSSPQVAVGLGALITNFGVVRAIRSVRKTVEEKTALVSAERQLGQELIELEKQKEKWLKLGTILEGVRTDIDAALLASQANRNRAQVGLIQSQIELKLAEKQQADLELLQDTEAAVRDAERYEMKARAAEAQGRFERGEVKPPEPHSPEAIAKLKKDHEEIMVMKRADSAKYGSEEAMPEFLRAVYDRAEDGLGFR